MKTSCGRYGDTSARLISRPPPRQVCAVLRILKSWRLPLVKAPSYHTIFVNYELLGAISSRTEALICCGCTLHVSISAIRPCTVE